MTRSNRNFALAYLLLVALPVVGLAGVLRSGRNITAPLSIAGSWKIQASQGASSFSCGTLFPASNSIFTVSQSGTALSLSFANPVLTASRASLDGTTLSADIAPASIGTKEAGCVSHTFTLTATVDPKSSPRSFRGVLRDNACPACAPLELQAVRDEQSSAKGGR